MAWAKGRLVDVATVTPPGHAAPDALAARAALPPLAALAVIAAAAPAAATHATATTTGRNPAPACLAVSDIRVVLLLGRPLLLATWIQVGVISAVRSSF